MSGVDPVVARDRSSKEGVSDSADIFQNQLSFVSSASGNIQSAPAKQPRFRFANFKTQGYCSSQPISEGEKQKIRSIHNDLKAAHAGNDVTRAYQELLNSSNFKSLTADARMVILHQVAHYPDARSITNLERLCGRTWFYGSSLEDQQRSAKSIASASQDTQTDPQIMRNTLNHILNDDVEVKWVDFDELASSRKVNGTAIIELNKGYVPADNNALIPGRGLGNLTLDDIMCEVGLASCASDIFTQGVAHEINHYLNNDHEVSRISYRHFMAEYRAWYVGMTAEYGHPPSQKECYGRAYLLVKFNHGSGEIRDAFDNIPSEARQMVNFMARMIGVDPKEATKESVLRADNLSETKPGLSPEKSGPDDPVNLDNH